MAMREVESLARVGRSMVVHVPSTTRCRRMVRPARLGVTAPLDRAVLPVVGRVVEARIVPAGATPRVRAGLTVPRVALAPVKTVRYCVVAPGATGNAYVPLEAVVLLAMFLHPLQVPSRRRTRD